MSGEQVKTGEFRSIINDELKEVYQEVRADDKTREVIVPKAGKWGGKEGAKKIRELVDKARVKEGLPV